MRKFLFKAKKLSDGKWVKGSLVNTPFGTFIEWYEDSICNKEKVDPFTVCQFTGIKDSNGNEVYEGDIVVCNSGNGIIVNEKYVCVVVFKHGSFCLRSVDNTVTTSIMIHDDCGRLLCWEVIGNVFDNKAKERKE